MWYKALKTMPRLSRPEWDGLDVVSRWLVATRSAALVMSLTSAAIGGLLALQMGSVSVWMWLLVGFGLMMAHGTNNLINDYVDYARGVDRGNYFRDQYGPQPLETGFMTKRGLLTYAVITGVLALGSGIALGLLTGPLTWVLLGIGAFFLLFYTWPLKYVALGELSLLLVWGPLMIGGTYWVLAGEWSWLAVLAGLPYALGVSATLIGKHLDKMDMDREKKVYTLPVLIGGTAARVTALAMFGLMFAILIYLMAIRFFTPVMLFPFISLVYFFRYVVPMFRAPRPAERPPAYPEQAWPLWYVASSFTFTRRFGGWFLIALIADTLLQRLLLTWWSG
jgi:1,4-dihydroxy-2-naphthoate polyprenyltransferase